MSAKAARFWVDNFDIYSLTFSLTLFDIVYCLLSWFIVLLLKFQTSKIAVRKQRQLHAKTVRLLLVGA
ncbi:hypothetical protein ACVWXV_002539 [Thermostichus sp. OS-CIW-21]|jgi:hypothetical protein